jgi:threonine aldolase
MADSQERTVQDPINSIGHVTQGRFNSDNCATVCPEVLAAIVAANQGHASAYGDDAWTQQLHGAFSKFFDKQVYAFAVASGTAANALSLATLTPPYGAIFTHAEAHIVRDECGAPEFYSGGAKLVTLGGEHGKLTADTLKWALDDNPPSVHTVQPAALHLTQTTEVGTTYRPREIADLTSVAHGRGLKVHMDGARLANALAYLDCAPADVTWRVGIDVLSFGATKNGALAAEAVVFFEPDLVRDFELRRKRAGHLISKSRFISVQLLAYLESQAWRRNALRANSLARRVARCANPLLLHPVEANEVFFGLGPERKRCLRDSGFEFQDWGATESGQARFVLSWDQPDHEVNALCEAIGSLAG